MAKGRFEGLTDAQWLMIAPLLPADPKQRGKGEPHTPWRLVCNTILWVLINGSRQLTPRVQELEGQLAKKPKIQAWFKYG